MYEVRIHGRGGQGTVTAAELLSAAAVSPGKHAQAFPSFGSERTGAPVMSFCRIDGRPIRSRASFGSTPAGTFAAKAASASWHMVPPGVPWLKAEHLPGAVNGQQRGVA